MSKRLVFCVEGYTEQKTIDKFLKRWLDARLDDPVGISLVKFEGWSELVREIRDKAHFHLEESPKKDEIIAVIGLIDLYGPDFYPAKAESVKERYEAGRKFMQEKVGHEKFRQFFAVHETEAWLLSDHTLFPTAITKALSKVKTPETVNFDEPPAKLLDKLYQRELKQSYKKVVQAKNLFPKLDPNTVYAKCPYFARMMEDLLTLVKEARAK
jgi:hypothetical protein